MKRWVLPLAVVLALVLAIAVTGCGPQTASAPATGGSKLATAEPDPPSIMVNNDKVYLNPAGGTYDPSKYPKTAMTGAPSNISFFKPAKDEGVLNRDYPAFDNHTFKFLINMSECLIPQWHYMFDANGGTLNPALAKTGFKAAYIQDGGHLKMLSNFMLGYYDFAYVPVNQISELWSGHLTQNQGLWRGGDDYVVIGNSYNAGVDLIASPGTSTLRDLAGKPVGIMNVGYHSEMLLNKALAPLGMATASAGGNVKVEMGTPGFIMTGMLNKRYPAGFVWTKYADQLKKVTGYKTLLKWQDMGYGTRMPSVWLVVRRDIIEKYPEVVQAVVQANYDATKQAIADGAWKAPNDAAYNAYWMKYYNKKPDIQDPTPELIDAQANPAFLHDIIDYMTKNNFFKTPYTYDQLVDQSFYNKVKK